MADEGLHEIQLNGKQLVFLFMTGTIVAVVIFLCGVMVGRGVRVPRVPATVDASAEPTTDPTAAVRPSPAAATSGTDGAPIASQETVTYPDRLEAPNPPPETLRDEKEPPVERQPAPPPPEARAARTSSPAGPASNEPKGNGFVVQVAATRERGEADTIAKRLAAKGYPSFVTTPSGAAHVFRVRVGKYADRHEAESVASRLQREEQFKPWITK
jgi:cell division septation protein DedD